MAVSGIQVFLTDMDGVLRHWTDEATGRAEDAAGLPRGALMATAGAIPEYEQGTLGQVTYEQWCSATEEALAREYGVTVARVAVREWRRHRGDLDPEMVALVAQVRRHVPVGLLSNAHDCLTDDLGVLGLADAFDAVIGSAAVHLAKPDPAVYLHAADVFGVAPEDCFFTDDLPENVQAAQALGLRTHRFTGVAGLRQALGNAGLDVPVPAPGE